MSGSTWLMSMIKCSPPSSVPQPVTFYSAGVQMASRSHLLVRSMQELVPKSGKGLETGTPGNRLSICHGLVEAVESGVWDLNSGPHACEAIP